MVICIVALLQLHELTYHPLKLHFHHLYVLSRILPKRVFRNRLKRNFEPVAIFKTSLGFCLLCCKSDGKSHSFSRFVFDFRPNQLANEQAKIASRHNSSFACHPLHAAPAELSRAHASIIELRAERSQQNALTLVPHSHGIGPPLRELISIHAEVTFLCTEVRE